MTWNPHFEHQLMLMDERRKVIHHHEAAFFRAFIYPREGMQKIEVEGGRLVQVLTDG